MPSHRIPVVDDDPDVADLVALALRKDGFKVEIVHGGTAALDRLATEPYDLVVCDLVMPEVNGISVYRAVEERPEPRPAMLFLSGYHDAGGYEEFLRGAGVQMMPKPFDVDDLKATVRQLLA